jgi:hypothetical protein
MIVSKVKRTSARGGQRNVASRVRPAVWSGGAVTIVVVVAAVLVGAGGLDAHRSAGDARHGRSLSPPGATAITTTTTTTTTPVPAPPYPIEDETITLFDPTRDTPARGDAPATSGRLLVTDIRRPIGPTGPLPLVVFAHGWNSNPTVYETLLDAWAAAGYLVAAPVFPDSANTLPGSPVSNYPEQAFDLSFIITSLLGGRAGPVDPTRIAVAGHSDGGTDVALLALNPAYSRSPGEGLPVSVRGDPGGSPRALGRGHNRVAAGGGRDRRPVRAVPEGVRSLRDGVDDSKGSPHRDRRRPPGHVYRFLIGGGGPTGRDGAIPQ